MSSALTRETQAKQLLNGQMSVIQTLTQGDAAKSSAFASAILSMVTNKTLAGCNVESIIKNGVEIVRLGLNPNPTFGQAYVVAYGSTAQLQIGYKGFITLAARNGWKFRAVPVYKCDGFQISFAGIKDDIDFSPNYDAREEDDAAWVFANLRGVIVYAIDGAGSEYSEFVPFKKLEKLRLKSQNQKDPRALKYIWAEWSEEMYKAKALKYVATRLPITEQMQAAINAENEVYVEPKNEPKSNPNLDLNAVLEAQIVNPETGEVTTAKDPILSEEEKNELDAEIAKITEASEITPAEVFEVEPSPRGRLFKLLREAGAKIAEARKIVSEKTDEQIALTLEACERDPNTAGALIAAARE